MKNLEKGFTLIELILYISLLSIFLIGVFSSVLLWIEQSERSKNFSEVDYQLLIRNFHE